MANIKVSVDYPISDGTKLKFRTPCESTEIDCLVVKCPMQDSLGSALKTFTFSDAHGTELSGVGNVFTSDVMIEVILDVTKGRAFIQNADTNSYIESIKETLKRMDEERQEIFAEAGKAVDECNDATKDANYSAKVAKDAAAGVVTIEQNTQDELRFWVGTEEEYEEKKDTFSKNTFCIIKNDETEEKILNAISEATETANDASNKVAVLRGEVDGISNDVEKINTRIGAIASEVNGLKDNIAANIVKRQIIYEGDAAAEGNCDTAEEKMPLFNYIVATLEFGGNARRVMFNFWYESQTDNELIFMAAYDDTRYTLTLGYIMRNYGNAYSSFKIDGTYQGEPIEVKVKRLEAFYVDDDFLIVRGG